MDRLSLSIVQDLIKEELHRSHAQLGLLGGPMFALFYTVCGIPVARLAERTNRAKLLAGAVAFWSAMTAACGAAVGFFSLGAARMGMGAGEGGCVPIIQATVADTLRTTKRGLAMSFVAAGPPSSSILLPLLLPPIVAIWGWRGAFVALAIPGFFLALLLWFTVKDPRAEGETDAKIVKKKGIFFSDLARLMRDPAYVLLFIGGGAIGTAYSSVGLFQVSFLLRVHEFSLVEAGQVWSIAGMVGLVGSFTGGFLADKFSDKTNSKSYLLTPAFATVLTFILFTGAFLAASPVLCVIALIAGGFTYNLKNGPIYASIQLIVPNSMRATGAAVHMFAVTTIGSLVGPTFAGFTSDFMAATMYGTGISEFLAACPGGSAPDGATVGQIAACATASAEGLRWALVAVASVFIVAGVSLFAAAKFMKVADEDAES
tara:strand:+ start:14489 stop:15778 length:1290 start_codon:yes stop_codon:yes gene_type:complete